MTTKQEAIEKRLARRRDAFVEESLKNKGDRYCASRKLAISRAYQDSLEIVTKIFEDNYYKYCEVERMRNLDRFSEPRCAEFKKANIYICQSCGFEIHTGEDAVEFEGDLYCNKDCLAEELLDMGIARTLEVE